MWKELSTFGSLNFPSTFSLFIFEVFQLYCSSLLKEIWTNSASSLIFWLNVMLYDFVCCPQKIYLYFPLCFILSMVFILAKWIVICVCFFILAIMSTVFCSDWMSRLNMYKCLYDTWIKLSLYTLKSENIEEHEQVILIED
jgi:hypothetical protein